MIILAKTKKGTEFIYDPRTARKVSKTSAEKICNIVNSHKSLLGLVEDEIYHVYEIDKYSNAYQYAQFQSFTIRNGIVTARSF